MTCSLFSDETEDFVPQAVQGEVMEVLAEVIDAQYAMIGKI